MFSPNDYGAEQKVLPAKQFEGYQPPEPKLARMAPRHRRQPEGRMGARHARRRTRHE